ncbi:MAG: hypothetical protein KF724_10400 [Phycisphaeraceae bacterium]|nr:hypothetical protein [Phycisphaeraceae bacterium]
MAIDPRRLLASAGRRPANASNLPGIDYRAESEAFAAPGHPIIDAHSHVHGVRAAAILQEAMDLYGISEIWSMTSLQQVETVRGVLGERIRFIAIPDFASKDRIATHGAAFADRVRDFHAAGATIVKFWCAPRGIDLGHEAGQPDLLRLDAPHRRRAMDVAASLGMTFMVHVADPDTWFATKYADAHRYGTKLSHYEPLERLLDCYPNPWIAAHLGGFPEDLDFLDGLLERHGHLHLDASATKWMVREVSRHPPERVQRFMERWRGRLLFGSDIVTTDDHLEAKPDKTEMGAKASNEEAAFDLYASRYWALRVLWEGEGERTSPIADPDLAMVDPKRHGPMDAPLLRGMHLSNTLLADFYFNAAAAIDPRGRRASEAVAHGRH